MSTSISALQAFNFIQPGVNQYGRQWGIGDPTDYVHLASFPGGNTGILRHLVHQNHSRRVRRRENADGDQSPTRSTGRRSTGPDSLRASV